MACNPTKIEISNSASTTVQVTVATWEAGDPEVTVTLEVDGLGIDKTATTSSGVATMAISAVSAANNSIWDATIQIGTNRVAIASAIVVETNVAQVVGITVDDTNVSYCAPTAGGGGGATTSYSDLTSGTVQIDLLPSATGTLDLGSADFRWAEIHGDLAGPVTFRAKASSGTLAVGDVVYIDGLSGGGETPTVAKASASSPSTMPAFGVISQGGTAPAEVHITTFGSLSGVALPAATYTIGQNVYVSTTAGEFTNTAPTGESNLIQNIGFVARTHDTNGILKVGGAGRSNAVPNLNSGNIFYGNGSNQATSTALTSVAEAAGAVSTHAAITSGVHGISTFGASLVDDADAATARTTLGLGTAATSATGDFEASGAVSTHAAVTSGVHGISSFGATLVDDTTAAAARTTLGLGTLATQSTIQDSYLMLIESPTVGKTYTLDGRVAAARTITNYYAKTSSGTCTAVLKNLTDATTIGSITVTSTGASAGSLSNTAVDENDRLGLEISIGSTPADLEIVVEYTQ